MEKISRELSARFSELGCQVSQDEVDNLIALLPGAVADVVLVSTHTDTVGADIGIQPIIATGLSEPTDRRFSGPMTSRGLPVA
jgi:acetylornithine deacetylase/succinyl-diaminopimelate desuccinylase-like protein